MPSASVNVPDPFWIGDGNKLMLKLTDINIGERYRKDMGDIDSLKDSIEKVGQLQPLVITRDRTLIAGHRRIEALEQLCMDAEVTVALSVTDAMDLLIAEQDENTCRKSFSRSEAHELGKAIRAQLKSEAAARRAHDPSADSTEPGNTRDKVAQHTGIKPTKQAEMDFIEATAYDQDLPDSVRDLALAKWEQIQADDKQPVHPLFVEVKNLIKALEKIEKASATPEPEDEQADADAEAEGQEAEVIQIRPPARQRLTVDIGNVQSALDKVRIDLNAIYTDDRFPKSRNGAGVKRIGQTLATMSADFENYCGEIKAEG